MSQSSADVERNTPGTSAARNEAPIWSCSPDYNLGECLQAGYKLKPFRLSSDSSKKMAFDKNISSKIKNFQLLKYIHTTRAWSPKVTRFRYSSKTPTFYQNDWVMRNTADVTGGKPIAVWLQSISGGDAVYPLVAFNDIHGRERCTAPDTTGDI
jgi:hypothetical protein